VNLRARLLTGMSLVAVVLTAASFFITRTTERNLTEQVDAQLERADVPRPERGPGGGRDRLSSVYVLYFRNGEPVVLAEPNLRGDHASEPPTITVARARLAYEDGEPFTVGGYRAVARATQNGFLVVFALPLEDVDEAVHRLITVEVVAVLAVIATLALVSWWVIRLGIRPLKQMTRTATAIADGDLSQRVPDVAAGTEAGELGGALNRMLGTIEQAFDDRTRSEDRLKRFVADASHELRTPITTIRGYAELYRNGALDHRPELDEAMRRTEQEAVRMGGLVDDLLHLARLDQGRPIERVPVDLAALARDAARDAQAVDPERRIRVEADPAVVVSGDEARLRQVLANLVTNAVVHTEPGTPVTITAQRVGDDAVLVVADRGPGMEPDVAARAFERFYRADPSRARHRGGSGLGLAIVEATVVAHGGTVHLETAPGEGTSVRVVLPLTS
jgi:two-component system OmpR family sensor kinase